jgi:hypothetical protein
MSQSIVKGHQSDEGEGYYDEEESSLDKNEDALSNPEVPAHQ